MTAASTSHASPITHKHATSVITLLATALACVALRCVSSYDPFPYWSGDPFLVQSPVLGLTPAFAIITDTLCFASSTAVLVLCLTGRTLQLCVTLAMLAATVGLAWQHFQPIPSDYWDGIVLSRHWLAGFTLAFATVAASRHATLRRAVMLLTTSTLVGIVLLVLAKGFAQIIFEHPQMMKAFRANKDAVIAAQGWEPNSPMARAYIRRLEQPEATGWFGLANIFATLCAAGFTTLLTLLALSWQNSQQSHRSDSQSTTNKATIFLAICTAGCAAGVYFAGSKGGFAVAALGVILALFTLIARREPAHQQPTTRTLLQRVAAWIGPALVAASLLAIIARGLIGERLTELSLLFRWFYMQGAAKIFAAHPLGVGAAGFKDAYMIHKPALSPEDTSFAHGVLIDWIVALGPLGILAVIAWLLLLRNASKSLIANTKDQFTNPTTIDTTVQTLLLRNTRSIACFALLAPTALAAFLERDAATPEASLTRALGVALALATAWSIHVLMSKRAETNALTDQAWLPPALAAGAIVAAVQCQIELTGVMGGSAAWCLALLGAAAARSPIQAANNQTTSASDASTYPTKSITPRIRTLVATISIIATALCAIPTLKALNWEHALKLAYDPAAIVQEFITRRSELAASKDNPTNTPIGTSNREALAQDLSKSTETRVGPTNSDIDAAIEQLQLTALEVANSNLSDATSATPLHFPTLRASTRIDYATALLRQKIAKADPSELDTPIKQLVAAEPRFNNTVNYWSWLGTMSRERARSRPAASPELTADLNRTITAWTHAHDLSPHDTIHALKLSDLYAELNQPHQARDWATKALAANSNMRLDPLRQLTDAERTRLQARAR